MGFVPVTLEVEGSKALFLTLSAKLSVVSRREFDSYREAQTSINNKGIQQVQYWAERCVTLKSHRYLEKPSRGHRVSQRVGSVF